MAEAKWYVVHTYSGYENKVKANIEKTIENNKNLAEQILEVSVPLEDVVEVKNGVKRTVQRKLFPGYVLVNMEMNDDTWYVVRNTRGVTGFVGPGSKPIPLTDAEMKPLGFSRRSFLWILQRVTVSWLSQAYGRIPWALYRSWILANRRLLSASNYLAERPPWRSALQRCADSKMLRL